MNFYSYAPNGGMQYHETGREAKEVAEKAMRQLVNALGADTGKLLNKESLATDIATITWGEVTERAAVAGESGFALKNQLRLSYEEEFPQVVDGRMRNENDDLVLVKNIHEKDLLYHDLVLSIAAIWMSLAGKIERFKGYNFRDVGVVNDLLHEKYNITRGGKEGNMTFYTFDRKFKLIIAIQPKIDFGPEIQMAEKKFRLAAKEMMAGLSTDDPRIADLDTLITNAFTLHDGKLRVSEVLRLRRNKMNSQLWNEGLAIVDEAIIVASKKKQIRLYRRDDLGSFVAIPLDIAAHKG